MAPRDAPTTTGVLLAEAVRIRPAATCARPAATHILAAPTSVRDGACDQRYL